MAATRQLFDTTRQMNFRENLEQHTTNTLSGMIKTLRLGRATRKAEQVALLNKTWISNPHSMLKCLSEHERLLLAECVHYGGCELNIRAFNAKYGLTYVIPPRESGRDPVSVIHCFITAPRYTNSYELVDDIEVKLEKLLPEPPLLEIETLDDAPSVWVHIRKSWKDEEIREEYQLETYLSESTAIQELRRMLQLTTAGKLLVGEKTGWPSTATQRTVETQLVAPDLNLAPPPPPPPAETTHPVFRRLPTPVDKSRPFAWPVLLQQCGWAKARGTRLELTVAGKKLANDFDPKLYRAGVQRLLADDKVDEFKRVTVVKGQGGRGMSRYRYAPSLRKDAIAHTLELLPSDRWVATQEFYRALTAEGLCCDIVRSDMDLYIGDSHYGRIRGYGRPIGTAYFRQFLGESLTVLGMADIAYSRPHGILPDFQGEWGLDDVEYITIYDGVAYFRLTPLGRYCLGIDDSYAPPAIEQRELYKVLPNLEIVATDPANLAEADTVTLDRFARRVSDAVWRMSGATVFKALESGDTAEDILALLAGGTPQENLPATVTQLIEDTAKRATAAIEREEAVIVTFRDEQTAALVAHDNAAQKSVVGHFGASVVVRSRNLRAFQTALRGLGIVMP